MIPDDEELILVDAADDPDLLTELYGVHLVTYPDAPPRILRRQRRPYRARRRRGATRRRLTSHPPHRTDWSRP
jgi:hypothetical protein